MKLIAVLLLASISAVAQISGAGNLGCSGIPTSGTGWTSATSSNATQALVTNFNAWGALVQLDQTSTLTGGAVTFEVNYDTTSWITVPVAQVLNASTLAQLTNPYTLVASTNQAFLIPMNGASNLRVKLSTVITGTATVTPWTTQLCTTPVLQLDASGRQVAVGAGTAGTAAGGVLTVQGVASMTKLLVTPDALPANQSVNTAQVNGVNTLTGAGATGTGSQRETVAQDTTTIAGAAPGTAGTASANVVTVQGVASMTKLLVTPDSVALPANQSVNTAQVNGVNTLTGAGATGTGSQRETVAQDTTTIAGSAPGTAGTASANVITVQGVASMTKLLVTPDSVALPANQSINVSQINGVTPLMGNGTTGTGSQRVTIASDNTAFAVNSTLSTETTKVIGTVRIQGNLGAAVDAATGAAPPANAVQIGGLGSGATGGFLTAIPVCDSFANINISTATTTLLVTGVSGRHVRICHLDMIALAADNVGIISGTGATCGTGSAAIVGTTAATGYNLPANGGISAGSGLGTVMRTVATGDSVCAITSAATQLSGVIAYTIY